MNPIKTILVVEDCVISSLRVGRLMEQALPGCKIMRAQTCFEARLLLSLYDFGLCILDVHLPDGCGLDLIPATAGKATAPEFIVLTADRQPEVQQRSKSCGVKHFLSKPFATATLHEMVRTLDHGPGHEPAEGEMARFTASLERLCLMDVIQLKCLGAASTRLELFSSGSNRSRGHLDLVSGEIVHAELRSETLGGIIEGEAALIGFLSWPGGMVTETTLPGDPRRTIDHPWQSLLLSAVQKADEETALCQLKCN